MSNIMLDNTKEERLKMLKMQKVKEKHAKLLAKYSKKICNDYE